MAVSWIAFHLTDRCQLDCDHCLRDPARRSRDIPADLLDRVLGQATKHYRVREVALTGGEPTLHPQFAEVVDAIVRHGLRWRMVTNGATFDKTVRTLLEVPGRRDSLVGVDFSLDGAAEATHDAIRGVGSFRAVLSAAARADAYGIPFVVQMAVQRRNVAEVESVALLAAELGAVGISFEMTQPTGTPLDGTLRMEAAEAKTARERIERLAGILSMSVTWSDNFPAEAPLVMCDMFRGDGLHVDVHGALSLCCRHSGIPADGPPADRIADLRTTPLTQAHAAMVEVVAIAVRRRIDAIGRGEVQGWDASPCNFCLKCFARPHWTETGVAGPSATRERWRGARATHRAPAS